jgi:glyoxylase-like metal-dependent hydrolase (beta-lactamase superfamily II)
LYKIVSESDVLNVKFRHFSIIRNILRSCGFFIILCVFAKFVVFTSLARASQSISDQYPQSLLYSKPVEVIPHVWSAIGATAPPGYDNSGHNNNLSFIVTGQGVVVINAGASYLVAKALHNEIKAISDEPVVLIINENAQGHAMLGNAYWHEQKVPILAHKSAAKEWQKHGYDILKGMQSYNLEKADKTVVQGPTEVFDEKREINLGRFEINVLWLGLAHSPGDVVVHLPAEHLVISGDMAFHERLLPIMSDTRTKEWLDSWERFEALNAQYVIPGHGHPTNMAQVRRYTKDYLVFLRGAVADVLDKGGDLQDSYKIDQSAYSHLDTYSELAAKNAGRVFAQMEFE